MKGSVRDVVADVAVQSSAKKKR